MVDDSSVRLATFDWLREQVEARGEVLPRELLSRGFVYHDERVPLVSPQGIFKPRLLEHPLSITTVPDGPYDDLLDSRGWLAYRYRGTDPNHADNVGLRQAMRLNLPLVYFVGLVPGRYLALWPVYVVGDDPAQLTFTVAVDDAMSLEEIDKDLVFEGRGVRRQYVTQASRRRLHQQAFRERVLRAYRSQCSLCRLRHRQLLDAAHIVPDSDPEGEPTVQNGLALCKLHHAAFDSHFIGITPELFVEVRRDIRTEEDGPMLRFGLQEIHGQRILVPRSAGDRPDPRLLDQRYQAFQAAG